MWLVGSGQSQLVPGSAPIRSRLARAEASSAAAVSWTPLGSPVEPEVAITTAVPSGRSAPAPGAGGRSSSGRHRLGTVFGFHRGRGEGVQQIIDPGLRQAGVERQDCGTAAIQRRRERCEQAAGSGGGREQQGVQGTSGHQRKVNGRNSGGMGGARVTEWHRPEPRS